MLTDDYVRRGMSPEEARRVAVIRIGAPVSLKEQHRAPAPERLDQGPTGDTVAQDKSAILQGTLDLMVLKTRLEENLRSFLWDVKEERPSLRSGIRIWTTAEDLDEHAEIPVSRRYATWMPLNTPLRTTSFPRFALASVSSKCRATTALWCTPPPFSTRKRA
jgi:hypothetical protein